MKLCSFLSFVVFLHLYSNAYCHTGCMSLPQLYAATKVLCHQERDNKELWQKVIDCHQPISEQFLRKSNEAVCPNPKQVENTTDTSYSIQEVFFNFCGLVDGTILNVIEALTCAAFGTESIMSTACERKAVKAVWGDDVPCNIGKCILKLGLI